MTNKQLLIIDDDVKLCTLLSRYLNKYDFSMLTANKPSEGFSILKSNNIDLIILDVMLPEMDGFETLKAIRKVQNTPVIMLTARGETMDRIVGLELGADDYLPKPFEPRELLARIQTVLRRYQAVIATKPPSQIKSSELVVDGQSRSATLGQVDLQLTTMEFEILHLLMSHPTRVISRDNIMDDTRGIDWNAFNRSIDVAVSRLRTKLQDDAKHPRFIKTIWGRGYQFIGELNHDSE